MGSFRELKVWQKAHSLTLEVYEISKSFPREEMFGITSQLRRAVISVELNLAEGSGRRESLDFARFVRIARGSIVEVENLLIICRDLQLISRENEIRLQANVAEISRMLNALATAVRRPPTS